MRHSWTCLVLSLTILASAVPARADPPGRAEDEAAIRALIGEWYAQNRAGADGNPQPLLAPGAVDASPGYFHIDTGAASLGPIVYNSLAATSLKFSHEITRLVLDARFARAQVWERGYFYAAAPQQTYERAGSAIFVLEKQDDGRWLILAHQTNTVGIPPNMKTDPMPDLRDLYYATEGKNRDPLADAAASEAAK
jgi:hypothetical protein